MNNKKGYFNNKLITNSDEDESSRFVNEGKEAIAKIIDGLTPEQKEEVQKGVSLAFDEHTKEKESEDEIKKEIKSKANTQVINSMITPSELGRRDAMLGNSPDPMIFDDEDSRNEYLVAFEENNHVDEEIETLIENDEDDDIDENQEEDEDDEDEGGVEQVINSRKFTRRTNSENETRWFGKGYDDAQSGEYFDTTMLTEGQAREYARGYSAYQQNNSYKKHNNVEPDSDSYEEDEGFDMDDNEDTSILDQVADTILESDTQEIIQQVADEIIEEQAEQIADLVIQKLEENSMFKNKPNRFNKRHINNLGISLDSFDDDQYVDQDEYYEDETYEEVDEFEDESMMNLNSINRRNLSKRSFNSRKRVHSVPYFEEGVEGNQFDTFDDEMDNFEDTIYNNDDEDIMEDLEGIRDDIDDLIDSDDVEEDMEDKEESEEKQNTHYVNSVVKFLGGKK